MNILDDPQLVNLIPHTDVVIGRFQFRLFKKLFRFDIIKEASAHKRIFECDELLCENIMDKIKGKELTREQIELMYKDKPHVSNI